MPRANSNKPIPAPAHQTIRLAKVQTWLARGGRATNVMLKCRKQWGVSESTAWAYIAKVRDRWAADAAQVADRGVAIEEMSAQARELLTVAWEDRNLPEVRRALVLLADLKGLRLRLADLARGGAPDDDESPEDVRRELEELLEAPANTATGDGTPDGG